MIHVVGSDINFSRYSTHPYLAQHLCYTCDWLRSVPAAALVRSCGQDPQRQQAAAPVATVQYATQTGGSSSAIINELNSYY